MPSDDDQLNRLRDQSYHLCDRLAFAMQLTQNLISQRHRIAQDHQRLIYERQRLLQRLEDHVLSMPPF